MLNRKSNKLYRVLQGFDNGNNMCLGVPFKILEINDNNAIGEINNFTKKFRIDLLPNASVGDYVMVHAGFAIQKLKKEDAENIIEAVLEVQNESM